MNEFTIPMNKKFLLIHTHKNGVDFHFFSANSTVSGLEKNKHSVCEMLTIDFEEDKGESVQFVEIIDSEIPHIVL